MWRAITDPQQLETLSEPELFACVWPLLRQGRLTSNARRLERIRPNIRSVCAELALEWQQRKSLNGRPVEFGEYLAACLCNRLRALDREQYPELYDQRGAFRPGAETLPLPEEADEEPQPLPTALITPDFSTALFQATAAASDLLQAALTSGSIAPASQPPVLGLAARYFNGETLTGYSTSRALGASREQARNTPATSIHFLLHDLTPPASCATGPL